MSPSSASLSVPRPFSLGPRLSLFLLSAAALIFEINLTRLLSVAQFYHFAFMIVSIALLGSGASGTFLSLFPALHQKVAQSAEVLRRSLVWLCLAAGASMLGAYLLMNGLPFDSYSIAWDGRQVWILALHYLALAAPFFFCGMAVSLLLAAAPHVTSQTYAINLLGSALGCAAVLAAPSRLGGEGTVVLSCMLAATAAVVALFRGSRITTPGSGKAVGLVQAVLIGALLLFTLGDLGSRFIGKEGYPFLELRLSPYKSLSYALQTPGSTLIYQRWNSFSRLDRVHSQAIHSLPGLSYRYLQEMPAEDGLLVDGDDLSPVLLPGTQGDFFDYLPAAIAFHLQPEAEVLALEPRGGLDIATALALGARQVTAVEANPLVLEAASPAYANPRVRVVVESGRSYLRGTAQQFDVILLCLTSSFHPIRSGAYSLAEDYRYTVEAFEDALGRLKPDGILVVTRWLQTPPSESLRLFALAVTALENSDGDPQQQIVALRGYNTGTLLIKGGPFTPEEMQAIRAFASERAFDLTYGPGIRIEESNRYNILPESIYYQAFSALVEARPRADFYRTYPYDVAPPTDDRPFFGHFFKWSQAGQVLSELGKTWQPFGGAGYFVILALLALAVLFAVILILLPVAVAGLKKRAPDKRPFQVGSRLPALLYFGLIGLAFLMVEIPLMQRFILYLGHPAYAMTAVLFALLLFSGLGSQWSERIPLKPALVVLAILLLSSPLFLPQLFDRTLGSPLALRLGLSVVALAPAGLLMGIPFPAGLRLLAGGEAGPSEIPWIWAVNGAASVVSAVLAALLALSFGFTWVLRLGALCYAGAWLTAIGASRRVLAPRPNR